MRGFAEKFADKGVNARLLVTVGTWEQSAGPRVPQGAGGHAESRRKVDNGKDLADRLSRCTVKGLEVLFREFAEEDHGSVLLPAISRGVRSVLTDSR